MNTDSHKPFLTERFEDALVYAHKLHALQTRKANHTPYIAHLMSVAALVLEAGADEDTTIAALLHDAAEDQGGEETLAAIRERFGEIVAGYVAECSDTYEMPKPPWRERKKAYIARLPYKSEGALLITLADKLHNTRTILRDLRSKGDVVWKKFNGGKDGTLWYYNQIKLILGEKLDGYLVQEFSRVIERIERLAG